MKNEFKYFVGLPAPANCMMILGLPFIFDYMGEKYLSYNVLYSLTLFSIYMLNSKIKLISLKKINPSGFLEIMLGFFLLLFCIRINQINLSFSFLTLSLITISCSICILYSLWFFISTTTIWFVKTWNATEVLRSFLYIGRFPLNSFSFSLRVFFSIFIPIAFITTIPSEVFLGLSQSWKILLEVIVASVFLITSRKFWLFALKFYSSASS